MKMVNIAIFIFVSFLPFVLSINDVYLQNGNMYVNGKEFIVKGVDYSPAPLGRKSMQGSGYGGTGFCSAKMTPWGEYKSACYDSDYFDGSPDYDVSRFPTGFKPLWERDFPKIKEIGANTIRLYNANPSTRQATQIYKNLYPYATGKDHTQFMDYAAQYGLYVIFPLYSDDGAFANTDETTYKRYLRNHIDEVGNKTNLLMWQIGNEMSWTWSNNRLWNDTATMAKFNRYCDYIRRYTKSRWGRDIPVTTAIVNQMGQYFNYQVKAFHVDIFSSNVFGDTFGNLFTGDSSSGYSGMTKLSCRYNKPFLMTEFYRTYRCCEAYPKNSANLIWSNIVSALTKGNFLGGVYFEQTDEAALGKDFGAFNMVVGYNGTQNSTTADVILADAMVAKQQFYDLRDGSYNGKLYNFKSDVWQLLGRTPSVLNGLTDPCKSIGTYKTCPTASNTGYGPRCSGMGTCDRSTGYCSCGTGWTGSDCNTPSCPSNCNGRGTCSGGVSPPECICNSGYYGPACASTTSSVPAGQCPNGCSSNGVCDTNAKTCTCYPGWIGADCAAHTFNY